MKYLCLLPVALIVCNICSGQTVSFDTLLKRGKSQFKPDLEKPDYSYAIENLKKAAELKPDDAETHYFLGYAYSRFNSDDGATIPGMQLPLVFKASDELEKVKSLTPLYTGEIIVLDPYSKITSEWGAMALSYIANHKPDSAKWAFKEGKKRGGFDELILSINRAVLNSCSQNSILISSGDNYTFPLCYLQTVEKLRTDVVLIDIDMIGNHWYPKLLEQTTSIKFGIKEPLLDSVEYEKWSDSTISIPVYNSDITFSWLLKPTYQNSYILRPDRLLMSLLKENKFKRDVFFTKNFIKSEQIGLSDYFLNYPIVDKLNPKNEKPVSIDEYIKEAQITLQTFRPGNPYSQDEFTPTDGIRWEIIKKIKERQLNENDTATIRLFKLLDDYLPEKAYPCYDPAVKQALENIRLYNSSFKN